MSLIHTHMCCTQVVGKALKEASPPLTSLALLALGGNAISVDGARALAQVSCVCVCVCVWLCGCVAVCVCLCTCAGELFVSSTGKLWLFFNAVQWSINVFHEVPCVSPPFPSRPDPPLDSTCAS